MTFCLAVLKETAPGEKRVALTPTVTPKVEKLGAQISIQARCGEPAFFADSAFQNAVVEPDPKKLVAGADIVVALNPPEPETARAMKPGAILMSFVHAQNNPELVKALCDAKVTCFAMEKVPRISRAQSMDALSSQAALAGYLAPLLGAVHLPRILPMMTTAVGSLRAATVLVMGLGVAGLSALGTTKRLGAITEGYDVRPETKEQAESLGAKFVDTGVDGRGEGGYARELTPDEKAKVAEAVTAHIAAADMIITTAGVPGKTAPKLISAAQVAAMKPGSIIVDLVAESGGNCELTKPGEIVVAGPATIVGPLNVPSMLAQHASELYAKNLLNLLQLIAPEGTIKLDFDDEVISGTILTHDGAVRSPAAAPAPAPQPAAAPASEPQPTEKAA